MTALRMRPLLALLVVWLAACVGIGVGSEHHVAVDGDDSADGSAARPLRTIAEAAQRAFAGDVITVHAGVYRERVDPPRGGTSDAERIVYRAAPGERVEIKGSELVRGWQAVQYDTWKATVPNAIFGAFNPYRDVLHGDWFDPKGREHHAGAVYLDGDWLQEAASLQEVLEPVGDSPLWFAAVDQSSTTIWAQFEGVDPNRHQVEINVRQAVFYPSKPGIDYLTVRGFIMRHAATPWASATAEQVGLIGTHWSKGWVIEDNVVSHSRCTGITLGKYGDRWDNTSAATAAGYVQTVERALERGWSSEKIGHHLVRNNVISHCEQAGIAGSLGGAFSTITGNVIHDIYVQRQFGGDEMAGIKLHGAIDTEISHNRIFRTVRGIWLDWMAQGTLLEGNLLYDNANEDLLVEVNHGPFLVANNIFLSGRALSDVSEGGAYVHNLIAGRIDRCAELGRQTPYLVAHGTEIAGLSKTEGGDNRFINNIFVNPTGLVGYNDAALPLQMSGNVFLHGAIPSKAEGAPFVRPAFDPEIALWPLGEGLQLQLTVDAAWGAAGRCTLVNGEQLGRTRVSKLPFVRPDGRALRIATDYFGHQRDQTQPFPGPFALRQWGRQVLEVWPAEQRL